MEAVYILHYDEEVIGFTSRYGDSRHYVGISNNVKRRIMQHYGNKGSNATREAKRQGIKFKVSAYKMVASLENEKHVTRNVTKYCSYCEFVYGKSQFKEGWSRVLTNLVRK